MVNEILKQLPWFELTSLRSVCKLWNELVSVMTICRLIVDGNLESKEKLFHSNRPHRKCEVCHPNLFIAQCKRPTFLNLTHLVLGNKFCDDSMCFDCNRLNVFNRLVHLEIHCEMTNHLGLHLPNLEILLLGKNYDRIVMLDCEKLRVLSYWWPEHLLNVRHPETIRVLESDMSSAKLAEFKGLEQLKCTNNYFEYNYSSINIAKLISLKKLEVLYYTVCDVNDLREDLEQIMRQKQRLGRSDLMVYFSGLRLIEEDLSDIDFELKKDDNENLSIEQTYLRHYGRLQEQMLDEQHVNYSDLFDAVDVLPEDYFRRFSNLRHVTARVSSPVDEQHFATFLRQIYCLQQLKLYGWNLSQRFFDSLSEFSSLCLLYLSSAKAREKTTEHNEVQLNLSFIGKLKKMQVLEIHENLSLQSVMSLVNSIENLKPIGKSRFEFWYLDKYYSISPAFDMHSQTHKLLLSCGNCQNVLGAASSKMIIDYLKLVKEADYQSSDSESESEFEY